MGEGGLWGAGWSEERGGGARACSALHGAPRSTPRRRASRPGRHPRRRGRGLAGVPTHTATPAQPSPAQQARAPGCVAAGRRGRTSLARALPKSVSRNLSALCPLAPSSRSNWASRKRALTSRPSRALGKPAHTRARAHRATTSSREAKAEPPSCGDSAACTCGRRGTAGCAAWRSGCSCARVAQAACGRGVQTAGRATPGWSQVAAPPTDHTPATAPPHPSPHLEADGRLLRQRREQLLVGGGGAGQHVLRLLGGRHDLRRRMAEHGQAAGSAEQEGGGDGRGRQVAGRQARAGTRPPRLPSPGGAQRGSAEPGPPTLTSFLSE